MIREKIFRLQRHKSSSSAGSTNASGQKFDFTFSNIQANQVPKGWDKVSLSLISSESGKTVRKTAKVPVKNGTCQWTETFSESIWISDVDDSSKELEQHLFKFLVATGSSKSGMLGETTINVAAFLSSESPVLVSLPLRKCNHGTILQVEVRCLTPKTNHRDEKWKELHKNKYENANHDNIEYQSEISDCKSIESLSSNNISNSSRLREVGSRETSFSASVSRYSFDSMDDSMGRQSFSSQSDRNGGNNVVSRQDSIESNESTTYSSYSGPGSVRSVRSLQNPFARGNQGKNQREELRKSPHATAPSLQKNGSSSETFKEAGDSMVQDLEAEARMWEQNARKLGVDLERLRKELSDQNLNVTNLNMELAKSRSECEKLSQEVEHLKLLLEESSMKQNVDENSEIYETARSDMQKEFEDELRFQKDENENLLLQLKKTQGSNIELISVLQEMEETIDKQKLEIESLSADKVEFVYTNGKIGLRNEDCSEVNVNDQVSANESKSLHGIDLDNNISEMSVSELELQNMQEAQQTLQRDVLILERTLQDKIIETEIKQDVKNLVLKEFIVECNHRLATLSKAHCDENLKASEHNGHVDVSKEIRQLKERIQELETDCNELTEENLELLVELKELRQNVSKCGNVYHNDSTSEVREIEVCEQPLEERNGPEILDEEIADLEVESEKLELLSQSFAVKDCNCDLERQEKPENNHEILMEPENNHAELVKLLTDQQEENIYLFQRVSGLEAQLRYITDKSESSRLELQHSESKVTILENQIRRLEEEAESQKIDTKQKLMEMQKQWSEAHEECTALSKVNVRLQTTTESLVEEYNSLQQFNAELRKQKMKLQDHCMVLEAEARKNQDFRCGYTEDIGTLEVQYSFLKEETTACVSDQVSETDRCYGYEDKNELESTLDEVRESLERSERENKVVLAGNQKKLLIMFENMMNGESKSKSIIHELESRIKLSELERLRLSEENSLLHMQLQKVPELQNKVLALRLSVKEMESQYQLLEASFKSMSGDYEDLKCENIAMVHKISSLQKAVSEMEDCRRKKNALEDKILRLEGDLIARDALCVQNVEMKNELNQIKIANSQFLIKVKYLENVREDLQRRVQSLESSSLDFRPLDAILPKDDRVSLDNSNLSTHQPQSRECSNIQVLNEQDSRSRKSQVHVMDYESKIQLPEGELAKALEANDMYKLQIESAHASRIPKSTETIDTTKTEDKISQLEAELQEIRERYFQVSLKYAEVEDEREQLVMKLKALGKW